MRRHISLLRGVIVTKVVPFESARYTEYSGVLYKPFALANDDFRMYKNLTPSKPN